MSARFLLIASVCSACSLDGLADGGGAGAEGGAASTVTVGGAGAQGGFAEGAGGSGGEPPMSRFVWLSSIGNAASQATSPFPTDPHGSSLRMSTPDESGAVWLGLVTRGVLDPDGPGGFEPAGMADAQSLFLLELQADGSVTAFEGYVGPPAGIENGLSVDGIVRNGAGVAVVGSFRTGSIDLGIGTITQPNTNSDDGYLLVADADGQAIAARHFTGLNNRNQTARAVTAFGGTLFVAGKLKQSFSVVDASDSSIDAACAFEIDDEIFERGYVASFDDTTLACDTLYTLTAVDNAATQQVYGVAADASGVYLAGGFTRQIIATPVPVVPGVSGEEGFVVALKPDLAPGAIWVARSTSSQGSANDSLRSIFIAGNRLIVGGYLAAGTGSQTPTFGKLANGAICTLEEPVSIDGFVGALKKNNGDCIAAVRLGGDGVDQVRMVTPDGEGVLATGFTEGIEGLETTAAVPLTRNGFLARLDDGLMLTGGAALGGTALDYVDGARAIDGGFLVAGSYGLPFDFLTSQDDVFVGKIELE
jgi:hypothetical protein